MAWPTRAGLFFLDPVTGRLQGRMRNTLPPPRDGFFGNVAFADGVLIVVTPNEVWGYHGEDKPISPVDGDGDRKSFDVLIGIAEEHLKSGETVRGLECLMGIVQSPLSPRYRAWAAARMILLSSFDPQRLTVSERLLDSIDKDLKSEWIVAPNGILLTLGDLLAAIRGPGQLEPMPFGPHDELQVRNIPPSHGLTDRVEIVRTLALPRASCPLIPLARSSGRQHRLFAISGEKLIVTDLVEGTSKTYRSAGIATHAAEYGEGCVVAGPSHVAVYGRNQEPIWQFRVPELDPLPDKEGPQVIRVGASRVPSPLSSFLLVGSRLVARLGDHHLISFDLGRHRVDWVLGSNGRPGYFPETFPDSPRFESQFTLVNDILIAQLSNGKRGFIDADRGTLKSFPHRDRPQTDAMPRWTMSAKTPWVSAPAALESHRIALSDDAGLVRFVDLETGTTTVEYRVEGPSSLSGEAPQVRCWNSLCLVAIRRNHGIELDRIDPKSGSSQWRNGPHFLDTARVQLELVDSDTTHLYVTYGNRLRAIDRSDGSTAWTVDLPINDSRCQWIVHCGKNTLLVFPAAPIARQTCSVGTRRLFEMYCFHPPVWQLPVHGVSVYDAWIDRLVPIFLLDPQTGEQVKRLDLPACGPIVTPCVQHNLVAFNLGDRIVVLR